METKREYVETMLNGRYWDVPVHKINNDVNGNPRYVVHFLDLGIKPEDYGLVPKLTKYRGKWFGGGYVFQSYNVKEDIDWILAQVKKYYETKGEKN